MIQDLNLTNKDDVLRLLAFTKRDFDICILHFNCRNAEEFLTLPTNRIVQINKCSKYNYNYAMKKLQYILELENRLQIMFEEEANEFLDNFKYDIITEHKLYHIKSGLQEILRSYGNNDFICVKSFKSQLIISTTPNNCGVKIIKECE